MYTTEMESEVFYIWKVHFRIWCCIIWCKDVCKQLYHQFSTSDIPWHYSSL